MKISSGISEIRFNNFQNNRITSEKVYLWPLYNAGKVEKIHGVTKRTETNITYSKPSPEDTARIMNLSKDLSKVEYTSSGILQRSANVQPGLLFDAIV